LPIFSPQIGVFDCFTTFSSIQFFHFFGHPLFFPPPPCPLFFENCTFDFSQAFHSGLSLAPFLPLVSGPPPFRIPLPFRNFVVPPHPSWSIMYPNRFFLRYATFPCFPVHLLFLSLVWSLSGPPFPFPSIPTPSFTVSPCTLCPPFPDGVLPLPGFFLCEGLSFISGQYPGRLSQKSLVECESILGRGSFSFFFFIGPRRAELYRIFFFSLLVKVVLPLPFSPSGQTPPPPLSAIT